jgi:hypothetical protein
MIFDPAWQQVVRARIRILANLRMTAVTLKKSAATGLRISASRKQECLLSITLCAGMAGL